MLLADLVQESTADCSGTKGKNFDCLGCIKEEAVSGFYRNIAEFTVYNGRNRAFA